MRRHRHWLNRKNPRRTAPQNGIAPELARLSHVTQPRMSQILNLALLAPDIQEELLHLPRIVDGRDPIHEKMLRPISAEVDWGKQREMFQALRVDVGNQ